MINATIMGATGYVGYELARLLSAHPEVRIAHLVSHSTAGMALSSLYPALTGAQLPLMEEMTPEQAAAGSDVIFTALPHGASVETIPALYSLGAKIIDMSGDFRYDDAEVYQAWYGKRHCAPELLKSAVYGLCELHRSEVKSTRLVGNPGCYTTCSILGLAPLVKNGLIDDTTIVIDAKSGSTGAGKGPKPELQFCETDESIKAYGVATHRHTSEIEQELSKLGGNPIQLSFTPHLLPVKRGILATCYAKLSAKGAAGTTEGLVELYKNFYAGEQFVKIYEAGTLPELKHVTGSNNCAIGLVVDKRLGRVVVVSCIDNLIKGAAGQAVQNMNIMFGLPESTGLPLCAWGL